MKEELKTEITRAILERAGDSNAVLFSGGVDSTLIAKILKDNRIGFRCYTAGFPGAEDIKLAEKVADNLSFDLKVVEIKNLEKTVKKVMKVIETRHVVMVSVAIPFYVACSEIKEAVVFSGLGSEEIFAGYQVHKNLLPDYKAIDELSWKRLEQIHDTDIDRDRKLASHFGVELALPFLDPSVVTAAMKIPAKKKVSKTRSEKRK